MQRAAVRSQSHASFRRLMRNRIKRNSRAITLVMAFFMPSLAVVAGLESVEDAESVEPTHSTYLSLANEFGAPTSDQRLIFDCSDKIYVVAELRDYPTGKHQLAVKWVDPNQATRETTNYPFYVRDSNTRVWAWLSLARGAGAGIMQWIDPTAGLEEFIGEWTVELRIDGRKISETRFEVSC